MSITRVTLADGSARYRVRPGYGAKQRTFERKADAVEWEAQQKQIRVRKQAGLSIIHLTPLTFDQLVVKWVTNFLPGEWQQTMVGYSRKKWGDVPLLQMDSETIGKWIHSLNLAPKTKSHILTYLRKVLDAAVEWGYLERNPARSIGFKAPGQKRLREIQPFTTWDEVLQVAEAVAAQGEPISSPLIRFVCATGLRAPGEVMSLTPAHIQKQNLLLRVDGTKTKNAARLVPLSVHALEALDDVPWPLDPSRPLWINRLGRRLNYEQWRRTDWRAGLESLGLPHRTAYEMRHTFATLALGAGAPIDDVASAMGHADISETFNTYRKWIPPMADRLRATLNTIGKENERDAQESHHQRDQHLGLAQEVGRTDGARLPH